MNKTAIAAVTAFVLWGIACGMLGNCIGDYSGRAKTAERAAERLANAVYRAAKNGDFASISADKLATESVADGLKELQRQKGAIRSWRVVDCYVTPIGLPVIINLEVQRNKLEEESLVIHSRSLTFESIGPKIPVLK